MVIALSTIEIDGFWMQAATLAVVGIAITLMVYGAVAVIVKMDDVGLWLSQRGQWSITRALGRAIVRFMPRFLQLLTVIGTAAMIWVGGSIIVHSVAQMGWPFLEEMIHHLAHNYGQGHGFGEWAVIALVDFILGFAAGLVLFFVLWGSKTFRAS